MGGQRAVDGTSYAEDRYNSLNSFIFTNAQGQDQLVRWFFVPEAKVEELSADQLKKARGANFLDVDITQRVQSEPQHWNLIVTVANPGDPSHDPSKAGRTIARRSTRARWW